MFSYIWHTFFFDPAYNTLVFFIDVIPGGDVGLAIIATIVTVKLILFPLSVQAVKTQKVMREIEPKVKAAREEHKNNREEQAKALMAIYKDANMNPFASFVTLLIQIPIIIALYLSVYSGGGVALPAINTELLYSFVASPVNISMNFLGLMDITERSIFLALLAGVTQYIQVGFVMPKLPPRDKDAAPDMKEDFMRNMQLQMKYVMPALIAVVAYSISAAIALYFVVSNIMAILQELYVRRHR